jgi:hypothetical protein
MVPLRYIVQIGDHLAQTLPATASEKPPTKLRKINSSESNFWDSDE